jgi:hypothetical protein
MGIIKNHGCSDSFIFFLYKRQKIKIKWFADSARSEDEHPDVLRCKVVQVEFVTPGMDPPQLCQITLEVEVKGAADPPGTCGAHACP